MAALTAAGDSSRKRITRKRKSSEGESPKVLDSPSSKIPKLETKENSRNEAEKLSDENREKLERVEEIEKKRESDETVLSPTSVKPTLNVRFPPFLTAILLFVYINVFHFNKMLFFFCGIQLKINLGQRFLYPFSEDFVRSCSTPSRVTEKVDK